MALLSLALAGGCAKGGNGIVPPPPAIDVTISSPKNVNSGAIYPTQSLTLTATVSHASTTAVNWSLGPAATCTGTPNPCGTLTPVTPATTPATATYVAPACVSQTAVCLSGAQPTVTATLAADTTVKGSLTLNLVDITTELAPSTLSMGKGLTQQFTAVAVPDTSPQTFTWSCTANGVSCASFVPDSNVSALAVYTANDICSGTCNVQISAASTLDQTGCSPTPKNCTIAKPSLVASRASGTYAFRFSGYDSSNHATAVVGTFTVASNGAISGLEDEMTSSGPAQHSITGGSYAHIVASDPNSNNAGTLTLTLPSGVYPNQYQVVLDGAGDLAMIESDGHGTGSGIAQKSASANLFTGNQTFAFGFAGVDSSAGRVGYVGILPMDGNGNIVGGQMDVNDNGNATDICGTGPCSIANATAAYTPDPTVTGLWHMTITPGTAAPMKFDFFIASGSTSKANPLTFYAISTDPVATHPAVSGTMVLQDSSQTYNIAAFKGTSVSALTGTVTGATAVCTAPPCANVSLTLGTTDGSGNFFGQFDQNNAGVILSAAQFPPTGSTAYTYAASGTTGRYTFNMLGDPTANPVKAPLPFVLYASGANRGFLLDQSSPSVMTGTMNPQGKGSGSFAGSELPGTFGAATTSSGSLNVSPIAANLLLTFPGGGVVSGTQYQFPGGAQTVTGTLDLNSPNGNVGAFAIALTAPSAQNFVIYVLDTAGPCNIQQGPVCSIQSFLVMDVDKTNPNPNPSIIFAQE
jgi:hypothetical protein